jgi:hypothetical protein
VLVAHYLESAIWQDPFFGGSVGEGDPSFSISVPVEQFRTEYTILVPQAYSKNFLSISATAAGAVTVDGLAVALTPFAGGTYRGTRMQVNAGQHKIVCPASCGVEVYGYSDAVSTCSPAGSTSRRSCSSKALVGTRDCAATRDHGACEHERRDREGRRDDGSSSRISRLNCANYRRFRRHELVDGDSPPRVLEVAHRVPRPPSSSTTTRGGSRPRRELAGLRAAWLRRYACGNHADHPAPPQPQRTRAIGGHRAGER